MNVKLDDFDDFEQNGVMENLLNDRPSPLELQIQIGRVNAAIAATEHRLTNFAAARNAHGIAERAYRKALQLLQSPDTEARQSLEEVRAAIEHNRCQLGL